MARKTVTATALILVLLGPIFVSGAWGTTIGGLVFEDANGNGSHDAGEKALRGVAVSDGKDVVRTGLLGRYRIETEADFVFVSVPGSHHAANNKFYRKIDASTAGMRGVDFPLVKNKVATDDGKFTFIFVTDTHAADYLRAKEGVTKAYGAVAELDPAFVIHGGDVILDGKKAELAEAQFELYTSELAPLIKAPFYHSVGNHDVVGWVGPPDPDPSPMYGKGMFKKYFGPTYYSFNYGHCHFIVLDSIARIETESGEATYHGSVDNAQIEWLKKDLATVPSEAPIILVTHVPMINALASLFGTKDELVPGPEGEQIPKHQVYGFARLLGITLKGRNLKLALAGHYHTFEEVRWLSNEHDTRFIVGGSICGEWWKGDHRLGLASWPEGFTKIEVEGDKFFADYIPYGWIGTEERKVSD